MKNILLIMIIAMMASFVMLSSYVSADAADWQQFGTSYQLLHQNQFLLGSNLGGFNMSAPTAKTVSAGYSADNTRAPYQPIVTSLGVVGRNYIIFPSGNFIDVYDYNLNFITEKYMAGTSMGQIAVTDFDNDGYTDDIVGLWNINASIVGLYAVSYNSGTQSFDTIYTKNFTDATTHGTTGVRCTGVYQTGCYAIYTTNNGTGGNYWWLLKMNYTDYSLTPITSVNISTSITEPPARWDLDNDGVKEYLAFTSDRAIIFDDYGTFERQWVVGSTYVLMGAKALKTDNSPFYKVALNYEIPYPAGAGACGGLSYSCARIQVVKVADGSTLWTDDVMDSPGSLDGSRPLGMAIADFDKDGYDDIFAVGARAGGSPTSAASVFDGLTGAVLAGNTLVPTLSNAYTYPQHQVVLGHMDSDNYEDMLIRSDGTIILYSPAKGKMMFTSTGVSNYAGCVLADLQFSQSLDIVCSASGNTKAWLSNYTNQMPSITAVSYLPGVEIGQNQQLTITINATDHENDPIYYAVKCSDEVNFTTDTLSNQMQCTYTNAGIFNNTIRIRDSVHPSTYINFTYQIYVSPTSAVSGLYATSATCNDGDKTIYQYNFADEQTSIPMINTIQYNLNYVANGNTSTLTGNFNDAFFLRLCAGANVTSYSINDAQLTYGTSGYVTRKYLPFTGVKNINYTYGNYLYDLGTASSTQYQYTFKDSNGNAYTSKYAALLRWYPAINQYAIVEMTTTDGNGLASMYVEPTNADYRLALYERDGTLIKLFDPTRFTDCASPPCTYIPPSVEATLPDGIIITPQINLQSSLSYATGTFTFTWNDPSQTTANISLMVYKETGISETLICQTSSTGNTGVLNCAIGSNTGSLLAVASRTSGNYTIPVAQLTQEVRSNIRDISTIGGGKMGLFITFVVLALLLLIGTFSPVVVIVLGIVALVPAYAMGSVTLLVVVGVGVIGGVVIHFMKRVG